MDPQSSVLALESSEKDALKLTLGKLLWVFLSILQEENSWIRPDGWNI